MKLNRQRQFQLIIYAFAALTTIVAVSLAVSYSLFSDLTTDINIKSQMRSIRIVDQSLKSYFQSLKIVTENAVHSKAFQLYNTRHEDKLRFETWPAQRANEIINGQDMKVVLDGPRSSFHKAETVTQPVKAWQIFKALPSETIDGRPVALDRRSIARSILKSFPDIHYMFEMDSNGDLVFLEPYEIQKNITSFNYAFRDYLALVKKAKRTSVSEGYISHDQNRTQIITVATPIFNESHSLEKVFAASISSSTLRERVFRSINANMDENDETIFYLVDRHGHVVASSSGEYTYYPKDDQKDDEGDRGNIRNLGIFKKIVWEDDTLEAGNMWERKTKSWVRSSLNTDYQGQYVNQAGIEVFGAFYPMSILGDSDKKWGILVETPTAQVFASKNRLRVIFAFAIFFILCLVVGLLYFVHGRISKYENALREKEDEIQHITRQVAHDVQSPIMALGILSETMPEANESQKGMLKSIIAHLHDLTSELRSTGIRSKMDVQMTQIKSKVADVLEQKKCEWSEKAPLIEFQIENHLRSGDMVKIPAADLQKVISNLLNNAHEAIEASSSGLVLFKAWSDQDSCWIEVQDNGQGIDKNHLKYIFSRGFTFGKTNGTGQGLSSAKEIIESNKGLISVKSEKGEGTSVIIRLPLLTEKAISTENSPTLLS